jgi:RNA-directed DNA polymerase
MKESHTEGLASHSNPESCASLREEVGEALTGAHAGGVLSRENRLEQGADVVRLSGKATCEWATRQAHSRPCAVGDLRHAWKLDAREPGDPPTACGRWTRRPRWEGRRPQSSDARKGKSDHSILPTKSPNKVEGLTAEAMEEREWTQENTTQQNTPRTQSRNMSVPSALERVRRAAKRNKAERFSALLHHVTVERLCDAFRGINRDATPGVDGVTWEHYEANLQSNLEDLHGRVQRGAYRAKPSRRAYIPKPDGRQRPLGVAALEDKILQRAVAEVLSAIYEVDFLGFSYGFRPGRRAHDALDRLATAIRFKKISWILDADVQSYFDRISHEWMLRFLQHRIADERMLALIRKWLKAGVIEDGQWVASDAGTPQGSSISPVLANAYLHYVFDLWAQQWRGRYAWGEVIIVRWADDFVMGFQYEDDAKRCMQALKERFQRFALELHPAEDAPDPFRSLCASRLSASRA